MLCLIIAVSCKQDEPELVNEMPISEDYLKGDKIVLGEKLENPYSVANMKKSLENLRQTSDAYNDIDITTTHLYVRFLPKDTLETVMLEDDSLLTLFDHPLLYEIEKTGQWYHDPELDGQPFTWQYTKVPVDYIFPDVKYEVLDELYMEGEEENSQARVSMDLWDALETEALKITGNLEEEDMVSGRIARRWKPSGRIRVEERILNQFANQINLGNVALRFCRVRARKLLKWDAANTSTRTGEFQMSKRFRGEVNYSLEMETPGFKVTNNIGFSINLNGPKRRGAWNWDIPYANESVSWNSATILNAIYHFRQQAYRYRLKLPGVLVTVKVRPMLQRGRSTALGVARHFPTSVTMLQRNDVRMYTRFNNSGDRLMTDDLYRVTMHELAHVSHFLKSPINAPLSIGIVGESWATAVEYYFTLPYYPDVINNLIDRSRAQTECCGDDSWKYTSYFIDLIDNTNQREIRGNSTNTAWADDDVRGYTLEQIQGALNIRTTLSGVASHLRNKYNNATEHRITAVTSFYNDIKENN